MAQKRKEESEFKVSDRRLFTSDGELRSDSEEEQAPPSAAVAAPAGPVPAIPPEPSTPIAPAPESVLSQTFPNPRRPRSSKRSMTPTNSRRAIWIRVSN
jgi:hypothetical protein